MQAALQVTSNKRSILRNTPSKPTHIVNPYNSADKPRLELDDFSWVNDGLSLHGSSEMLSAPTSDPAIREAARIQWASIDAQITGNTAEKQADLEQIASLNERLQSKEREIQTLNSRLAQQQALSRRIWEWLLYGVLGLLGLYLIFWLRTRIAKNSTTKDQKSQTEKTPFYPRSPYGVSKAAAYYMARVYRESYGMKIYCGFLFNHESPRRGEEFLTRKVAKAVAEIKNGLREKIVLGNLDAKRDFGYAKEYVEWIWRIMQHPTPDDFVIATGETHSVQEFVELAFKYVGIDNWRDYVEFDPNLMRPAEVDLLLGDATKSKEVLGFSPTIKFTELVKIMVDAELKKINDK